MNHIETKQIFLSAVQAAVGSTREINDGGTENGNTFTLTQNEVDGIADNLATWWNESYEETNVTPEMAADYLDETYPEA